MTALKRRQYLTALGGGLSTIALAGCVSDDDDTDADDDVGNGDDTDDDNGTDPDTAFSITPLDDGDLPVEYSVTLVGGGYEDPVTPLGVEIELTNATDEPIAYAERRRALFWTVRSDDERFALYPGDPGDPDESAYEFEDGCWTRTEPFVMTDDYQFGELDAGESHVQTLVLSVATTEECPDSVPDEMTFTTGFKVWESPDEHPDLDEGDEYEWGFSLTRE